MPGSPSRAPARAASARRCSPRAWSRSPVEPGERPLHLAAQAVVHESRPVSSVAGGVEQRQTLGSGHRRAGPAAARCSSGMLPLSTARPRSTIRRRAGAWRIPGSASRRLERGGQRSPGSGRRGWAPGSTTAPPRGGSAATRVRGTGPGRPAPDGRRGKGPGRASSISVASSSKRGATSRRARPRTRARARRRTRRACRGSSPAAARSRGRCRRGWTRARALSAPKRAPGRGRGGGPRFAGRDSGSRSTRARSIRRGGAGAPLPARPRPGARPGRTARGGRSSRRPRRSGTSRPGAGRSTSGKPGSATIAEASRPASTLATR